MILEATAAAGIANRVPHAITALLSSVVVCACAGGPSDPSDTMQSQLGADLTLVVDAPQSGAIIDGRHVVVRGVVKGEQYVGLTVNGRPVVPVRQGRGWAFTAQVEVEPSETTVDVIATDYEGHRASERRGFTSQPTSPYEAVAKFSSQGVAPFRASFEVIKYIGHDVSTASIEYDYDGNGEVDRTERQDWHGNNLNKGPYVPYDQPGTYTAKIKVTTTRGQPYEFSVPIVVIDRADVEQQLLWVWKKFAEALKAKDPKRALTYMTGEGAEHYGALLKSQPTEISEIASLVSSPHPGEVHDSFAELWVVRRREGADQLGLVSFVLDADGLWRIASL